MKKEVIRNIIDKEDNMNDLPKIPVEAKEIIKHKRTGKIYESRAAFDADVADHNRETTKDNFRKEIYKNINSVIKKH